MVEEKKTKRVAKKKSGVKKKAAVQKVSAIQTKGAAKPKEVEGFPIVGLGASAGGLEALEAFFSHMPPDSGIGFVIIQHLSPKHKSIMGSLLAKDTKMEVLEIRDGIQVQPNHVYLNPPNKNVVIINGTLQLMDPVKTGAINLPIDCFFRSMAEEMGEKAICVILSGTATDGTLGLKAVKGAGGLSMVQDPDSAKYDGMPRSAIATGIVDFILPVEKIPVELVRYVKAPYIGPPKQIVATDDQFGNYIQKIFVMIRSATGHDLSHYKQTTLRRRIERRMAIHQVNRIADYVKYLQQTSPEVEILFKDMLIGVTNFFRDSDAFDVLKKQVLPALIKTKQPDSSIRIWSVGCSTGEEAYSMAILFAETMEMVKQHFNIQIFASDIDAQAIDYARLGVYPDSIAADVSQERLKRYFLKEDNSYTLKKQIRDMIVFAVQNVIKDPPFSKIDIVSCRNLLIYMDSELQKKILPLCHYTLNPDGILFLGTSETIGEFTNLFHPIDSKRKIFKRKEFFVERPVDYPGMPFYHGPKLDNSDAKKSPGESDIQNVAEKVILENFALPGVLVNEKYEIIHFMGKTDKYLETPVGKASFNILSMAREGLRFKLGSALHNAVRQKRPTTYKALKIKYNGAFRTIDLTVRPLVEFGATPGYLLVMFDDKTLPEKPVRKNGNKVAMEDTDHTNPVIVSLEHELESTKEHLQTTIEEMETSNEELKSTNEELQSVNEELQSTNEELETSKEELQSTNEELVTVNTELQNKVDELSQMNNDINNLLGSTEIATIFLDTRLNIKRFTPATTKIFNLIQTDLDRPISDITTKIRYDHLEKDAKKVLDKLIIKEAEVQDIDGNWYSMRIAPYRTIDNVIDGVVITLVDINKIKKLDKLQREIEKRKKAEEALRDSEERLQSFMDSATDGFILFDSELNHIEMNKAALEMTGLERKDVIGKNVIDTVPNIKGTSRYDKYKKVMKTGVPLIIPDLISHPLTGDKHIELKAFKVSDGLGIIFTDITERKQGEEALRHSELWMRNIFNSIKETVIVVTPDRKIVNINEAGERMFGYSKDELANLSTEVLHIDHEHYVKFERLIKGAFDRSEAANFEFMVKRKNGEVFQTEHTVSLLENDAGERIGISSIVRDITERKKEKSSPEGV